MRARRNQPVRVMMLGWEYPPRYAGGLGKACQGLAQAMAKEGAQVFFVLPTFPERLTEDHLEVVGARECLIEAGWDVDASYRQHVRENEAIPRELPLASRANSSPQPTFIQSDAKLYPYGVHPEGPAPARIYEMLRARDEETRKSGWQKTILNPSPTAPNPGPPAKTEIYGKNLWSEIERYCYTVRQLAEAHEVDLVHAHDWMTFPAAFEFQKRTGAPVFLHVHATEYDRSGDNLNNDVFRIEREGFRRATHIFAVSKYTAGIIERLYGVSRKKISVAYNAPENNDYTLATPPNGQRDPQVIFLGRLTFQKGPDHFLRAAAMVAQADARARFILCGTGDMMDQLRSQAHRLGIESRTHFAGFVDPAGVDEILKHSKVLVMPSVSEPFGLVALEAIRCGIPVILSKQSGVREVLHRALQVDFWDHDKLADQILAALRLPDLSRQLVEDGMGQLKGLSWEKSASKIIDHYHKYLGSTYAHAIGGNHGH